MAIMPAVLKIFHHRSFYNTKVSISNGNLILGFYNKYVVQCSERATQISSGKTFRKTLGSFEGNVSGSYNLYQIFRPSCEVSKMSELLF